MKEFLFDHVVCIMLCSSIMIVLLSAEVVYLLVRQRRKDQVHLSCEVACICNGEFQNESIAMV